VRSTVRRKSLIVKTWGMKKRMHDTERDRNLNKSGWELRMGGGGERTGEQHVAQEEKIREKKEKYLEQIFSCWSRAEQFSDNDSGYVSKVFTV
jgi:hypothetical protein